MVQFYRFLKKKSVLVWDERFGRLMYSYDKWLKPVRDGVWNDSNLSKMLLAQVKNHIVVLPFESVHDYQRHLFF